MFHEAYFPFHSIFTSDTSLVVEFSDFVLPYPSPNMALTDPMGFSNITTSSVPLNGPLSGDEDTAANTINVDINSPTRSVGHNSSISDILLPNTSSHGLPLVASDTPNNLATALLTQLCSLLMCSHLNLLLSFGVLNVHATHLVFYEITIAISYLLLQLFLGLSFPILLRIIFHTKDFSAAHRQTQSHC